MPKKEEVKGSVMADDKKVKRKVSIALQGGGAHGSFAWGVLDRILEEDDIEVEGVSGTSAGAMNAAAAIQGLVVGGNAGAKACMKDYWRLMSELSKKLCPCMVSPVDKMLGYYNLDRWIVPVMMKYMRDVFSPYETNPHNHNPFEDFVRDFFDFAKIRDQDKYKVFLGTTHVGTGKIRVFSNKEISADVLMASACLPFLFQAVRIDGEYYWDGGYIANPAIYPLIENCEAKDIIVIKLRNTHYVGVPKTVPEINNRMNEITYNGCLVHEMRAIHFITKLIDEGKVKEGALKRINMHVIENQDAFKGMNLTSALNTDWDFITMLFESGRQTADTWLKNHSDKIGKISSFDKAIFDDFV